MEVLDKELLNKEAKAKKTMMLFGMGSIAMIFAGLTSAYVVSSKRPDWLTGFHLPWAFYMSTLSVILSSVTFLCARHQLLKNKTVKTSIFLWLTLALGILFVFFQFMGFSQIINKGYFFTGSQSSITTSFIYAIVLAHLAHLFSGFIVILVVIYKLYKKAYKPNKTLGFHLASMYWHFLAALWIYLILFFSFVG